MPFNGVKGCREVKKTDTIKEVKIFLSSLDTIYSCEPIAITGWSRMRRRAVSVEWCLIEADW